MRAIKNREGRQPIAVHETKTQPSHYIATQPDFLTWRDELSLLAAKHASLGITPDLVGITTAEAFGLLLHLRQVAGA